MYFLGIDFGGGSSKATLIDEKGNVISTSTSEYSTTYGSDGLATQKPLDWFNSAIENIKNILSTGINPDEIQCLCFDAATHVAVLLDENDNVLMDSIYWTDTRSLKEKEFLLKNYKDYIFTKSKHLPDCIWTLPQLMYVYNHQKEVITSTKHVLFAKDYVRHLFSNGYVTDYIEAEGSMLFDFDKNEWDETLLSLAHLNKDVMPKIVSPRDVIGNVSLEASKISGLSIKTKVIAGSTDTAMEVFAAGAVKKGDMSVKLATAGRICLITDKPYPDKNIINYAHLNAGLFYPGSGTKSCAASFRWLRDTLEDNYVRLGDLANNVPLGSDGLFFHPYLRGELTPYGNPNIRGSFFGLSSLHGKGHFTRALFEGTAFSLLDCLLYLKNQGLPISKEAYLIGGGSKSPLWSQIVSDVLNIKLYIAKDNDSSFGSALLAATSMNVFSSLEEAIEKTKIVVRTVYPNEENHQKYLELFKKYQKISGYIIDFYGRE